MQTKPEIVIRPRYANDPVEIGAHPRVALSPQAQLTVDLIARWGMVAGTPDGEDASGRQQGRLQTPAELVERAMAVAELAYQRLEEKDWLVQIPSYVEAQATAHAETA